MILGRTTNPCGSHRNCFQEESLYCDLHIHSTASDGTVDPAELAVLAKDAGLAAIALTDHDTTAGLVACERACAEAGIAFVPGIELSADPTRIRMSRTAAQESVRRGTLHILGLFVRHDEPRLLKVQEKLLRARADRNPRMIAKLNELGVRIDYQEVIDEAGGQVVGRPHIAAVLLRKGYVKSIQDAFARYIGEGAAAYVGKDRLSPDEAIDAIHRAGGLAMLAHPVQLRCANLDELRLVVRSLRDAGLDGIETRHSDHRPIDVEQFEQLAAEMGLLTTGGSDFHGSRKNIALGSQRVPFEVYEQLKDAVQTV